MPSSATLAGSEAASLARSHSTISARVGSSDSEALEPVAAPGDQDQIAAAGGEGAGELLADPG